MSDLTIRGLDDETVERLRREASRLGASMNAVVKDLLRGGLGLTKVSPSRRYKDLDALVGTWTEEEARDFDEAVASFERVEPGLWR